MFFFAIFAFFRGYSFLGYRLLIMRVVMVNPGDLSNSRSV